MRGELRLVLFLLLFLLSLFSSSGFVSVSRPSNFADPASVAQNESLAFDADTATFANISPSTSANLSYFSFGATNTSSEVQQLDLFFDIAVTGVLDDAWALEYFNGSWNELRPLGSGNQSRTVLSYLAVAGPWSWSFITNNLSVRIRYVVNGTPDTASLSLYEVWANVTSDAEGPNVTLLAPANNTNYTGVTLVNFSYNASDALSGLANCSLYLNGVLNQTNTSPAEGVPGRFSVSLGNGRYDWFVRCVDTASTPNNGSSEVRVVTVDAASPSLSLLSPVNTTLSGGRAVTFRYSFDDVSRLANCSLFLNGTRNQTMSGDDVNWPTGTGEFLVSVENGFWFWNVTCTDIHGYQGWSTTANFTQAANDPPSVTILGLPSSVQPVQGGNVTVWCNATITDQQGQLTITNVSAFLHRSDWPYDHSDESSGHLTSTSCVSTGINSTSIEYDCSFSLPYYARSMNWTCTYRAVDNQGFAGVGAASFFVEPLYAFSLSPPGIAYGAVAPGNISAEQAIVVVNQGNAELDLALDGYGMIDGDALALVCDVGNTSIDNERYALSTGVSWSVMTPLSDEPVQVDAFNLPPKNDSFSGTASLYWRVKLGVPSKGNCSGFVTFTALQS